MRPFLSLCAILVLVSVLAASASAEPSPSKAELKGLIAELQKHPGDMDLRGKIIDLAKTLRPAPSEPAKRSTS